MWVSTDMVDFTKSSPYDITSWRRDTSIKYPTFAPPPSTTVSIPNEKLAETQAPIPARPNYHSTDIRPPSPRTIVTFPLPATPAPSPPPSPVQKQKKQQFQTDPTKPFVFPYSHVNGSGGAHSLVPFAIAEADRLYHQHIYVPLSLYQLWQTREECQKEERGMGQGGLIGFERSEFDEEEETDQQFMLAEWKYEAEEMEQEANANREGVKAAKEKRLAAKRLRRADAIYVSTRVFEADLAEEHFAHYAKLYCSFAETPACYGDGSTDQYRQCRLHNGQPGFHLALSRTSRCVKLYGGQKSSLTSRRTRTSTSGTCASSSFKGGD